MDENEERKIETDFPKKKKTHEIMRENPWIVSTFVLGLLVVIMLVGSFRGMTGSTISEKEIGELALAFFNEKLSQTPGTLDSVKSISGIYQVNINLDGKSVPLYFTKDGNWVDQGGDLIPLVAEEEEETEEPSETILECVENYNITSDTIIFYYSNSCGWCSRMKPGVEYLEEEGYKFYWIEGSGDDTEIINDCIMGHMTSSGVPQFICVKTGEIHVGAFADEESNLDQEEMTAWVDACLAD